VLDRPSRVAQSERQICSSQVDMVYVEQDGMFCPFAQRLVSLLTFVKTDWRHLVSPEPKLPSSDICSVLILCHSYADLYARNLRGIRDRIPYFQELGLTYLHIMPPYKQAGKGLDDGILATSYRQIDEKLGSMYELSDLAKELQE
jgi:hypothetical protein